MPLAATKTGSFRSDRDERDEDQVGLHHRRAMLWLEEAERPGLGRIAGQETKRLGRNRKGGEGHYPANRTSLLHREQWADLASERVIAGDDRGVREKRC